MRLRGRRSGLNQPVYPELRAIGDEEFSTYARVSHGAFGGVPGGAEIEEARRLTELDRTVAAFEAGRMVATAGALSLELTLPGLTLLPVAGVTDVGVLPTHRRRGLLRSLMAHQLEDVAARGEAAAVLLASESIIYGRFGYGAAVASAGIEVDPHRSAFAAAFTDPGGVRLVEREEVAKLLPDVHDAARRQQPGDVSRPVAWWQVVSADGEHRRRGRGPLFWVLHVDAAGQPDGFASYRLQHGQWAGGLPDHQLHVEDLVASDPTVEAALWRFLLDADLVRSVVAWSRPLDEPLAWRLEDPRQRRVTRVSDFLWLRLLDVPAALSARRYPARGRLVLDVVDTFRPQTSDRYVLEAGEDGAWCATTTDAADLVMGITDLGACYLGGVRFTTLARAGRVNERSAGALARADAMFSCDPPPFCRTGF